MSLSALSAESQLSSILSSLQPSYRHPDMTKRDVMALLHHYKGLTPKGEKFIFNDGRERELLHLIGTIPVPYKVRDLHVFGCVWWCDICSVG